MPATKRRRLETGGSDGRCQVSGGRLTSAENPHRLRIQRSQLDGQPLHHSSISPQSLIQQTAVIPRLRAPFVSRFTTVTTPTIPSSSAKSVRHGRNFVVHNVPTFWTQVVPPETHAAKMKGVARIDPESFRCSFDSMEGDQAENHPHFRLVVVFWSHPYQAYSSSLSKPCGQQFKGHMASSPLLRLFVLHLTGFRADKDVSFDMLVARVRLNGDANPDCGVLCRVHLTNVVAKVEGIGQETQARLPGVTMECPWEGGWVFEVELVDGLREESARMISVDKSG
ncbi:hypothetical protein BKA70DRAFT_1236596 [Coprinopsis sp. MPI-PUGE-AT-0042]|nr:hypothetical protein BKA70DRAFT_1236596 [Coprinopsis sp. MPI-PUGE-AT-0042]